MIGKPVKARRARRRREIAEVMSPKAARKFEREIDNALIDLEEKVEADYEHAREIFRLQDERTQAVIKHMTGTMAHMAGTPSFTFRGAAVRLDPDRLQKIQERNFLWIAIRLLVACAEYDIQINNFRLPDDKCGKCGKQSKKKAR